LLGQFSYFLVFSGLEVFIKELLVVVVVVRVVERRCDLVATVPLGVSQFTIIVEI
jgi:hypothetical protein